MRVANLQISKSLLHHCFGSDLVASTEFGSVLCSSYPSIHRLQLTFYLVPFTPLLPVYHPSSCISRSKPHSAATFFNSASFANLASPTRSLHLRQRADPRVTPSEVPVQHHEASRGRQECYFWVQLEVWVGCQGEPRRGYGLGLLDGVVRLAWLSEKLGDVCRRPECEARRLGM